jgi:hypothetical protein
MRTSPEVYPVSLPTAELTKRLGASLHIGVVFFVSMLYFAGVAIPYGVAWPIWGLINLLLVPVTYKKVFQSPDVSGMKCQRCGSLMETKSLKCTNSTCGWEFHEPTSSKDG